MSPWTLAVDFGTSFTVTAVQRPGRPPEVVEVDGVARLPSAVFLTDSDGIIAGRAALVAAAGSPDRLERTPKRYLGMTQFLPLGGEMVDVVEAVAAVLRKVMAESLRRFDGELPSAVVLTHPVRWEGRQLELFGEAAIMAGIAEPQFLPEPVAAAMHYTDVAVNQGDYVAVYDLGGGTFDTAVLHQENGSYALAGAPGGNAFLGGESFDDLLFAHVGEQLAARSPALWDELSTSRERTWRKERLDLRSVVRDAKELLSESSEATVFVNSLGADLRLTRDEFETMIRFDLQKSVEELIRTVTSAGVDFQALAAVFLTGGSSRIPMVSRVLFEGFSKSPSTRDDPKCVVALGALRSLAHSVPDTLQNVEKASSDPQLPKATRSDEDTEDPRIGAGFTYAEPVAGDVRVEVGIVIAAHASDRLLFLLTRADPMSETRQLTVFDPSVQAVIGRTAVPDEASMVTARFGLVSIIGGERATLFDYSLKWRWDHDLAGHGIFASTAITFGAAWLLRLHDPEVVTHPDRTGRTFIAELWRFERNSARIRQYGLGEDGFYGEDRHQGLRLTTTDMPNEVFVWGLRHKMGFASLISSQWWTAYLDEQPERVAEGVGTGAGDILKGSGHDNFYVARTWMQRYPYVRLSTRDPFNNVVLGVHRSIKPAADKGVLWPTSKQMGAWVTSPECKFAVAGNISGKEGVVVRKIDAKGHFLAPQTIESVAYLPARTIVQEGGWSGVIHYPMPWVEGQDGAWFAVASPNRNSTHVFQLHSRDAYPRLMFRRKGVLVPLLESSHGLFFLRSAHGDDPQGRETWKSEGGGYTLWRRTP